MKKLLLVLPLLFSMVLASPLGLKLNYSGDGAIPTAYLSQDEYSVYLGYQQLNDIYSLGVRYEELKIGAVSYPTKSRVFIARTFNVGQTYVPYIGLNVGSGGNGLEAGIDFDIL